MTTLVSHFDPTVDRAAWLEWRRRGIGGSDIASILGWSRFDTPMSVYLDKVGMLEDSDRGEAARWGRLLEAAIANEFEERSGLFIVDTQVCTSSTLRPWMRCTLDGLVAETASQASPVGIAEFKVAAAFGWDTIPDEYEVQCQWNMGVAGHAHCWLIVLHGARRLKVYELDFDIDAFGHLAAAADRFWHDHVLAELPPPADSAAATTEALKNAYRNRADGEVIDLDDATVDAACRWLDAKQHVKDAQAALDLIENQFRAALGDAIVGRQGDTDLVTWKPQNTAARLDTDAMKADGVYDKYLGAKGTTRVLRATKALKEMTDDSTL